MHGGRGPTSDSLNEQAEDSTQTPEQHGGEALAQQVAPRISSMEPSQRVANMSYKRRTLLRRRQLQGDTETAEACPPSSIGLCESAPQGSGPRPLSTDGLKAEGVYTGWLLHDEARCEARHPAAGASLRVSQATTESRPNVLAGRRGIPGNFAEFALSA